MSRARPHYFPKDTPEPFAQPYSTASAFIDRVLRVTHIATGWAAVVLLVVSLALAFINR